MGNKELSYVLQAAERSAMNKMYFGSESSEMLNAKMVLETINKQREHMSKQRQTELGLAARINEANFRQQQMVRKGDSRKMDFKKER